MIHTTHAAVQLAAVMGAVGLPVVALVAPLRVTLKVGDKCVIFLNTHPTYILLFRVRIAQRYQARIRPYDLQHSEPRDEYDQNKKEINGNKGDGGGSSWLDPT